MGAEFETTRRIMLKRYRKFSRNESGVTAIEYGLIAAMVGVAIIGGVQLLGTSLNELFGDLTTEIETAGDDPGTT
jgi:pilus assembly protein Flp/PilA